MLKETPNRRHRWLAPANPDLESSYESRPGHHPVEVHTQAGPTQVSLHNQAVEALGACLVGTITLHGQVKIDGQEVVADIGGQKLTANGILEREEGGKLLQARFKYFLNQRKAVDDLIDSRLLAAEASKKHLTLEQLLEQEVYKQVKDPTEDNPKSTTKASIPSNLTKPYVSICLGTIRDLRRTKARTTLCRSLAQASQHQCFAVAAESGGHACGFIRARAARRRDRSRKLPDFECPYCEKVTPALQQIKKEYGDKVAIALEGLPAAYAPSFSKGVGGRTLCRSAN